MQTENEFIKQQQNKESPFSFVDPNKIGRKIIKCAIEPTGNIEQDKLLIKKMLEQTLSIHGDNVSMMDVLYKYYKNTFDLNKCKSNRPDIDNVIRIPESYRITRDLNGHICGSGVIFSDNTGNFEKEISNFNGFLKETKMDTNYVIANNNASIYGIGYYYIEPNNSDETKETPFLIETENIDPKNTYCVYNYDTIPKKTWAVRYYTPNDNANTIYTVWTKYAVYKFTLDGSNLQFLSKPYELGYGAIPIIEVVRNPSRLGDSELVLELIRAKSLLMSSRIDDVQQVVDYVYLLINLNLKSQTSEEKKQEFDEILKSRVIELECNNPQVNSDVRLLENKLDQTAIQQLADYIDRLINSIVSLPDRNSTSTGTSDTGVANDYKLGFRSLSSYSDIVTKFMIESLRDILRIALTITKYKSKEYSKAIGKLTTKAIDVKPQCNKIFSVTDAANAYSSLRSAGMNDTDSVKVTGISQDIAETVKRNKIELEEKIAYEEKQNSNQQNGITTKEKETQ